MSDALFRTYKLGYLRCLLTRALSAFVNESQPILATMATQVTATATDDIASTPQSRSAGAKMYDAEKADGNKDPNGAGAPELAEIKDLRYDLL